MHKKFIMASEMKYAPFLAALLLRRSVRVIATAAKGVQPCAHLLRGRECLLPGVVHCLKPRLACGEAYKTVTVARLIF